MNGNYWPTLLFSFITEIKTQTLKTKNKVKQNEKIISTTTLLAIILVFTSSCKKDVKGNPNGALQTVIPATFSPT